MPTTSSTSSQTYNKTSNNTADQTTRTEKKSSTSPLSPTMPPRPIPTTYVKNPYKNLSLNKNHYRIPSYKNTEEKDKKPFTRAVRVITNPNNSNSNSPTSNSDNNLTNSPTQGGKKSSDHPKEVSIYNSPSYMRPPEIDINKTSFFNNKNEDDGDSIGDDADFVVVEQPKKTHNISQISVEPENDSVAQENKQLKAQVNDLVKQNHHLNSQITILQANIDKLTTQVQRLAKSLDQKIHDSDQEIEALKKEVAKLKAGSKSDDSTQENNALKEEAAQLKAGSKSDDSTQENNALKEEIAQLKANSTQENNALKKEIAQLKAQSYSKQQNYSPYGNNFMHAQNSNPYFINQTGKLDILSDVASFMQMGMNLVNQIIKSDYVDVKNIPGIYNNPYTSSYTNSNVNYTRPNINTQRQQPTYQAFQDPDENDNQQQEHKDFEKKLSNIKNSTNSTYRRDMHDSLIKYSNHYELEGEELYMKLSEDLGEDTPFTQRKYNIAINNLKAALNINDPTYNMKKEFEILASQMFNINHDEIKDHHIDAIVMLGSTFTTV